MALNELLKDKKKRRWTILGILLIILAAVTYIQFKQKPLPEGAERTVICTKCKSMGVKVIVNIDDDKDQRNYCKLCGGRLRYAVKCRHCEYEFPLSPVDKAPETKPLKTMDKFRYVRDKELCPNCGKTPPDTIFIDTDAVKNKADL